MRRVLFAALCLLLATALLTGCVEMAFDPTHEITVVSREDGSGTRGAFVELLDILEKGADGARTDHTTVEAVIAPKTDVMLTNVANDPHAIGYVSLGSLSDTVKALRVDGVAPTAENIKNGSYALARPFVIATKGAPEGLAADFIAYILSQQGQAVVESCGYIAVHEGGDYQPAAFSGEIMVAGSSSVTPVMEKLKEDYERLNPNAKINIQMSDSTSGMTGTMDGTCDIGMASRSLKESESAVLTPVDIALDGIVIVVNTQNPLADISSSAVHAIFTGGITRWDELDKVREIE